MKTAESIEANTCFSELCNDHTALNMDSFEERDLSASYPSAQTSLNASYVSKSTKSVLFSAVKTTSSSSAKYHQELNRLLSLQTQLINPSFKVLIITPNSAKATSSTIPFTIQCQTNTQHIQEVTYRQARVLLNSTNLGSQQNNEYNQNCKHCRQDEKQRAKDLQREQEERVIDRLRQE